ncbi:MAG TPA: hypothetical protein VLB50_00110 [Ignavibacteriaceae bacterium]|nr:hypothetical protein [Ignavibacteriaceae bacterium]
MRDTYVAENMPSISDLGNIIPEGYKYYQKKIMPGHLLNLPGGALKWYELYPPDIEIKQKQIIEARAFLEAEAKTGKLKLDGELGFVILHRAGEYLLLLLTTWRNTNEMWESVYLKNISQPDSYSALKFENNHKGTYCVWELGIIWHERNAWVRFIESARDDAAKQDYLNNMFSGMI